MAAESRSVEFSYLVADYEHWTPEHRAAADADPDSSLYADWASARLSRVMREAGERFMAAHPDVFAGGGFL